jgi:RNA polymerase sigma-70 factor (ECF subfamily)
VSDGARTDEFETHRRRLTGLAYRMLGSWSEAEDAVQETWLRYAATPEVDHPAAWLTTVCARICLDQLRSARVRREAYVGPWLPEPLVERLPAEDGDPAEAVERADAVSVALLLVLERLRPEQRVAFVLHDAFAVPFDQIAAVLGTSPEAARQMASRARRAVADDRAARHHPDLAEQRRVVGAFLAAAQRGDLRALAAALAPDVVMVGDGGGASAAARHPVEGVERVARFIRGLFRRAAAIGTVTFQPVLVNGDFGLAVEARPKPGQSLPVPAGRPARPDEAQRYILSFAVADGRIVGIYDQLNPEKLARVRAWG